MKGSIIRKGLGFGVTSAVITTLGILVGVHAGTDIRHAVISAILIIAVADSMADSVGMYFSEEARGTDSTRECLLTAVVSFSGKLIFALTFLIPVLVLDLHTAIIVDLVYGAAVLTVYAITMARSRKISPILAISQHVFLAVAAITLSHALGLWVNAMFG